MNCGYEAALGALLVRFWVDDERNKMCMAVFELTADFPASCVQAASVTRTGLRAPLQYVGSVPLLARHLIAKSWLQEPVDQS
jgi:hypothetical protein